MEKTIFQKQYAALKFFSDRKDEFKRFGVGEDNGFFAHWVHIEGESGQIFFDKTQGAYTLIGDSVVAREIFSLVGIPESEVCFTYEIPLD